MSEPTAKTADQRRWGIRPLSHQVGWKGLAILDAVVSTFAETGSIDATNAALGFGGNSKAVGHFLFGVVGIPRGPHGGKRPHPDERVPYRHPGADLALPIWEAERERVLALYGVAP